MPSDLSDYENELQTRFIISRKRSELKIASAFQLHKSISQILLENVNERARERERERYEAEQKLGAAHSDHINVYNIYSELYKCA